MFGVELDGAQPGQGLVEVAPFALELHDALGDPLEPAPVLRRPGRIGLIQVQVFADRVDRKSEPPQSLDEGEGVRGPVIEDANPARCARARSARSPRRNGFPADVYPGLSIDVVHDILEEGARFSREVLAPINRPGDREGAQLRDGIVTTAPGFKEAYQAWSAAGWNALAGPPEYGGHGLPQLVNAGCVEMWNGACLAFGVAPLLTFGCVEAVAAHGCEDLKQRYLGSSSPANGRRRST